jgi:lipopolysaccharide assembly protein A
MRLLIVILVLLFAVLGAVFGALNGERVIYDFYFVTASLPKGAMLISALLAGWLIGGVVVYFGLVLRLRRRVRTLARELAAKEPLRREPPTPVVIEARDAAP